MSSGVVCSGRRAADLGADLVARGETIGSNDLWIAATAITHGLGLATRSSTEFARVPGLRLVTV